MNSKTGRKAQRKRRRERYKRLPKRQQGWYQLIDYNWTHFPLGYCKSKGGWLSVGLADCHKCYSCQNYEAIEEE